MKIRELISESLQQTVDSNYIYALSKQIHRNYDDFGEGDLSDRIFWFDQYKLTNLPLSKLNLSEWDVDEDLVADHVAEIMKSKDTMPPIVFDPIENSIIDGTHRANAYAKLGYNTIPAYVGSVKSSSYGERESEQLDEYRVTDRYDPQWMINRGNHPVTKRRNIIQTPLTDYNVRYGNTGGIHDYYLYKKSSDRCIGAFSIEENDDVPRAIKRLLAPGVQAVTPHMGLAPQAQRQGISTMAYSTFLRGGPWVFITEEHTLGAFKLWDSLVKGDVISFYVTQQGKVVDRPDPDCYRLLGPRDRFKST